MLSCPETVDAVMLKNFVNELSEVDAFLGELIEEMEDWDEPVVLVLYGDHLPPWALRTRICARAICTRLPM